MAAKEEEAESKLQANLDQKLRRILPDSHIESVL